jgi:hypothetical protein
MIPCPYPTRPPILAPEPLTSTEELLALIGARPTPTRPPASFVPTGTVTVPLEVEAATLPEYASPTRAPAPAGRDSGSKLDGGVALAEFVAVTVTFKRLTSLRLEFSVTPNNPTFISAESLISRLEIL